VVFPATPGKLEPTLERADVDVGDLAGRGAHRDVHAHEDRLAEADVELGRGPGERFGQDRGPALAQCGAEAIARREDQARDEALETIAAYEQAEALALAEAQDARDGV